MGDRRLFAGVALCLAVVFAGLISMSAWAAPEDSSADRGGYSAYNDAEKPVISFLLSDSENAEEFKREFGLSDRALEDVLAATRQENEALAKTYAESEKLLEGSRSLSATEKRRKIEDSSYDEEVRATVGETKSKVQDLLPKGKRAGLEAWVDEQWRQAVDGYNAEVVAASSEPTREASARGKTCKVFATQYYGYTRYEVALPHRSLKFNGGYKVLLTRTNSRGTRRDWAPVKEVGPWNTRDNYWQIPSKRTMWKNLRRCVPEAQAAYYSNYNRGKDEFGREVLNPAGVDLTPAVARRLGLRLYQNAWVQVYYPWVKR